MNLNCILNLILNFLMSQILSVILIFCLGVFLVVPYSICVILKFALWKYQFTSKPTTLFSMNSYKDIILRIPIGLNQNLLISIQQLSFNLWPIVKINIKGLCLSVLIKNEFKQWKNHQIEILKMLEEIRTRLKRNGLLSSNNGGINISGFSNQASPVFNRDNLSQTSMNISEDNINSHTFQRQNINDSQMSPSMTSNNLRAQQSNVQQRTLIQKTLRNLLSSSQIEIENMEINFYLYSEQSDQKNEQSADDQEPKNGSEDVQIDYQNIRKFLHVINTKAFLERYLCFRLHFPNGQVKVNAISDEDVELSIQGSKCMMLNPCFQSKQGILDDFDISVKLPINRKMMKLVGNYDISIKVTKANFDVNKKFIKKFAQWFVSLYTLQKIIKVAKNIILKTAHQEKILKNQQFSEVLNFENYRDTMIPKRLQISIKKGIDFIITHKCKKLKPFLDKGPNSQEFCLIKFEKTTFELIRKMQNTYYIIARTDKADLSINQNFEALSVENFCQEIDFTFRKELTDLPVKRSQLVVNNKIQIDNINQNLTPSSLNIFYEIVNMFKAMSWQSCIKKTITDRLLDDQFLKHNVLLMNQQKPGTELEKKVYELYKPLRYQDQLQTVIILKKFRAKLDVEETKDNPLIGVAITSQNFEFSVTQAHGKINSTVNSLQLSIIPSLKNQSKENPPLALFASRNLKFEQIYHLSEQRTKIEQYLHAQRIQVDINFEVFLDMEQKMTDFWFINKHFKNKWTSKYKVKEAIPSDIIERKIQVQDFTLIWNLSRTRFVNFNFKDLRSVDDYITINNKKYVSVDGQQKFVIKSKQAQMFHTKYESPNVDEFYRCCFVPIEHKLITGNTYFGTSNADRVQQTDKIQEQIIESENLEIRYETDANSKSLKISSTDVTMELPDKYHFSAVIYEMQKQCYHSVDWYTSKIAQKMKDTNFVFKRWKSSCVDSLKEMPRRQSHKNNSTSLLISIFINEPTFAVEENKMKKIFVDKSEVQEIMTQRRYFRIKQNRFEKFWNILQKNNLNDKYVTVKGKNLLLQFEIPKRFRNTQYTLDVVKSLDEGRQYIKEDTFKGFKPGVHTFKIDYLYMMARNMQRPIIELWKLNWNQIFIVAEVNPIFNMELFTTTLKNKIFQRFEMPKLFNKLLSKQYYDSSIDIYKLRVNIQGQTSLLFFNDIFQQLVSRFIWEDISRGRDPEKKYLKYMMSLDRSRARLHGQLRISILNMRMSVFAKRNFNRYDQYFEFLFNDFIFHQVFQKQQICMRDFIIKKEPLQQFETLFVKLPIIELKYQLEINEGRTLNHFFNQQNVESEQDWLNRVKSYMSKSQGVEIKLNIPTLGGKNETEKKTLYLPALMQSYADNSPIPIIHYQRSHMQFFDDFMREFQANRIDISSKVYKKTQLNKIGMNRRYTMNFSMQRLEKSRTKFQGFINDIVFIISDFKEEIGFGMDIRGDAANDSDLFGGMSLDEQFLSPEEIHIHSKKDKYLNRYNGILFTTENFCVKSEFTYRPNHVNYFEINDSLCQFNLFRFSKMTSKNLFQLRHPCFDYYRTMQFEQSMNNFSYFCQFFNLEEHKALEKNEKLIKEQYPQFTIPPVELIDYEMAITENSFYASDRFSKIGYDPSLKYKQLLGNFKTLFPKYILTNEQIQKNINDRAEEREQINFDNNQQELVDDFIFSETDTIGTVIHSEYRQDQQIQYKSLKQQDVKTNEQHKKNSQVTQDDTIHVKHLIDIRGVRFLYTKKIVELIYHHIVKGFDYKQFRKTDYIDLEGEMNDNRNIFLQYDNSQAGRRKGTNQQDQNMNHSRIINFKALQKEALVAIRLEQAQVNFQNSLTESQMLLASPRPVISVIFAYHKNQAPSLLKKEQQQFFKRANQRSDLANKQNDELQEEFENELQNLLNEYETQQEINAGESQSDEEIQRMKSLKYSIQMREGLKRGYFKDPLNRDSLSFMATTATYTGYQFSTNKDIIKYEMEIELREMDCYVAPTFINLENPTFWMNQGNLNRNYQGQKQGGGAGLFGHSPQGQDFGQKFDSRMNFDDFYSDKSQNDQQNYNGENLLRKIIFINDISFSFEFLMEDFVDNINPSLTLAIVIERLEGSMNGAEWWRFYHVIEQIIMSRGEKAAEVIQIENRRTKEMNRMKTDFIRDIINSKLKNQYKEQLNEIKPDIAKSISYKINNGKLKLFNQNKQFSGLDVKGVWCKSLIYSNKEAKQDLDIERITIENLLDGDSYRWVLYPGDHIQNHSVLGMHRGPPRNMVQCRYKDKFIVVSEAPWRVYDQIEMDIFPSSIQLTRNLYLQFKMFLFDQYYSNRNKLAQISANTKKKNEGSNTMVNQQEKKYQLLVPTKLMPKQQKKININPPQTQNLPVDELADVDSRTSSSNGRTQIQNHGVPQDDKKSTKSQEQKRKGHDGKLNQILEGVARRSVPEQQNIIQEIATQRDHRLNQPSDQIQHYVAHEQRKLNKQEDLSVTKQAHSGNQMIQQEFPVFFKYFRMNEISVTIRYFHEQNSFLNTKDLRIKLAPFISHYKFLPFKKMFDQYESHCKKVFISQIPNILKQKFLKAKQKVDEVTNQGVTNTFMQSVTQAVGHVVVANKLKKKKDKRKRKKKKAGGAIESFQEGQMHLQPVENEFAIGDAVNSGQIEQSIGMGSNQESEYEYDSEEQSDSDEDLDDEQKKAKEQYLQEIKETKLREARKILFGDFAVL